MKGRENVRKNIHRIIIAAAFQFLIKKRFNSRISSEEGNAENLRESQQKFEDGSESFKKEVLTSAVSKLRKKEVRRSAIKSQQIQIIFTKRLEIVF